MDLFTLIFTVLFIPVVVYYLYSRYSFGYWKRRGIYSVKPSFPGGNLSKVITGKTQIGVRFQELYEKTKHRAFVGIYLFQTKVLLVNDLDLIKNVLVRDFHTFPSHGLGFNHEIDPLSKHLFNIEGPEWKEIRAKLTPTFTSNKMKYMFDTLLKCSKEMELYLEKEVDGSDVDFREILAKYGTDVIGSCAFGIETNSFKHPDAEFRKMGQKIFSGTFMQMAKEVMSLFAPSIIKQFNIKMVYKDVETFFIKTIEDTIKYREQNKISKNDFLQLLIDMKKKNDNDDGLTLLEIVAQVYIFFIAGFETSSTTSSFALYELAKNPDVQSKLKQEIDDTISNNGGVITYDSLLEMKYLTQVIEETLRMYPPLPFLFRKSTADYLIPNTYTKVDKGTLIIIPILGIQRDPSIHKDPLEFRPERFSSEAKKNMNSFSSLPFGEGPRNCIGSRFGMMQTRLGLVTILSKFEVSVSDDTLIPMKFSPSSPILTPKGKHMLALTRRKC